MPLLFRPHSCASRLRFEQLKQIGERELSKFDDVVLPPVVRKRLALHSGH